MSNDRKWSREEIEDLLMKDDTFLYRALFAMNRYGLWTSRDEFVSSMYGRVKGGKELTDKQKGALRAKEKRKGLRGVFDYMDFFETLAEGLGTLAR